MKDEAMTLKDMMIKDVDQAIELYKEISVRSEDPSANDVSQWLKIMRIKIDEWPEDHEMFKIWASVRQNAIYELETPWNFNGKHN